MQFVTTDDVEAFVIHNSLPAELVVSESDFTLIYGLYRQIQRDDQGAFLVVLNTRIRMKAAPSKVVDLSKDSPITTIETTRKREADEAIAAEAAEVAAAQAAVDAQAAAAAPEVK